MPAGGAGSTDSMTKIFVGGLASTTDEDSLKEFYEQWGGEITDIVVMRDPATKRSRGFGFVTFSSEDQVDTVMMHRPHVINGKQVDPKRAVPREFQNKAEAQISSKKVYVGGLRPEHSEDELRAYFTTYGSVTDVEIVEDKKTGQKRGFAFVTFDDNDPADKVVLMRNHVVNGKRVECKKALSKDEMSKISQQGDSMARGARSRGPGGYGQQQPYSNDAYGARGPWNAAAAASPYQAPYNPAAAAAPYGGGWGAPQGGSPMGTPAAYGAYGAAQAGGYGAAQPAAYGGGQPAAYGGAQAAGYGAGYQPPAAGAARQSYGDGGYGNGYPQQAPVPQVAAGQTPQGWKTSGAAAGGSWGQSRNY